MPTFAVASDGATLVTAGLLGVRAEPLRPAKEASR
jgi:hypothetical protein